MISNSLLGQTSVTDPEFIRPLTNFTDTIACLSWGKDEIPDVLLCSTWNGYVYLYYVTPRHPGAELTIVDNTYEAYSRSMEIPCISLAWQHSAKKIITGSIDGTISSMDINASGIQTIGKHDDAVKGVYYIEELNLICSLSYDKTLKFWDMRMSGPASDWNFGAKVVCSDFLYPHFAVGLSNEKLLFFDVMHDLPSVFRDLDRHCIGSPLGSNSPLSTIAISKENKVGIATYDGRSNLSKFERRNDGTTGLENIVTFKAHKIDPGQNGNTSNLKILYPIHAVGFHPRNRNTYFTAGGDGCVNIWDIPARNKQAYWTCTNAPITAAKYSPNGKLLAYAYGYDYAKGIEGSQTIKPKLHIHSTQLYELAKVE